MHQYDSPPSDLNTHRTEMLILAIMVAYHLLSMYQLGAVLSAPTIISYFCSLLTST